MSIARLFTQSVSVRTFTGSGAYGDVYADPVDVKCFINDRRELTRDAEGSEVVSETTLYAPLSSLDTFAVGSLVTVNGRTATVLSAYRRDSAGPVSAHHAQITLA